MRSALKRLGILGLAGLVLVAISSCGSVVTPLPTPTEIRLPTETVPLATSTPIPTEAPTPILSPTATPTPTEVAQPAIHIVQVGDTLSGIAERYGTTVQAIVEANEITDPNLVKAGQELVIPIERAPTIMLTPSSPIFGAIVFSDGITADYRPTNPRMKFPVGTPRIYATFTFEGMSNGMSWTYAWYQEGKELWTETTNWRWGERGPAFLYYDGLLKGNYEVKLYIEGALQQSASFTVE